LLFIPKCILFFNSTSLNAFYFYTLPLCNIFYS
jgi:hypothetical protein